MSRLTSATTSLATLARFVSTLLEATNALAQKDFSVTLTNKDATNHELVSHPISALSTWFACLLQMEAANVRTLVPEQFVVHEQNAKSAPSRPSVFARMESTATLTTRILDVTAWNAPPLRSVPQTSNVTFSCINALTLAASLTADKGCAKSIIMRPLASARLDSSSREISAKTCKCFRFCDIWNTSIRK